MAINKKRILLFLILFLFVFFIAYQAWRCLLREQNQITPPLSEQLQSEVHINSSAKCAEEIDLDVKSGNGQPDSIEQRSLTQSVIPKVVDVKRNQTWEKTLKDINSKLLRCHNWFDTVQVLSMWLYQNTRIGDTKYDITRVIPKHYVVLQLDLKYLYELNNSDSVIGDCGFHSYYALQLYNHYGIKSYYFSMRPNRKINVADGHMFNVLENPHNKKWYPVDNFFGIRYRYNGEWLDMEKYFQLLGEKQLCEVSIETFGMFKFHIQDSPYWDMENMEVASVESGNYPNHFRIAAPYTLKRAFAQEFKALFDSIAATYNQPPHPDWIDLARRMPMYGARQFAPWNIKEQSNADSLLSSWKRYPMEIQNCPR